ncbi:MAG: response regulator [Shimia sp.]
MARLALVDDDREYGVWFSRILQREGHDVDVFVDAAALISELENAPARFDQILVDLDMPDMGGVQWHYGGITVLRAIRRIADRSARVVVHSGMENVAAAETARKNGADIYIAKTVDPKKLIAEIFPV